MKNVWLSIFVVPIFSMAQVGHYPSSPVTWNGKFDDDFNICVMSRENEIVALGNLSHNVPHGKWVYLRDEYIVKEVGFYKNGLRHGYWISYDVHGTIQSEGKYKKGKLHGNWIFYGSTRVYKNGIRIK